MFSNVFIKNFSALHLQNSNQNKKKNIFFISNDNNSIHLMSTYYILDILGADHNYLLQFLSPHYDIFLYSKFTN